jgi:hypothetical protein
MRIRHKEIEILLNERGLRVLVRCPKHESKSADAYSHNDYLKKYC